MIHKRKHKNPKALVVGIGKWGKVMTKCLINFGYKVKYANKNFSKSSIFEEIINSEYLSNLKLENTFENEFDLLVICVKPKDIFNAWKNFNKYSNCILIEKPGPQNPNKLKEIFDLSKLSKKNTIINYEYYFTEAANIFKTISLDKEKEISSIEVFWSKKLQLKGDLDWRILPHMIGELFIFKKHDFRLVFNKIEDDKILLKGLINKIPFIIKFVDDENKLFYTKLTLNNNNFYIKKDNNIYNNLNLLHESKISTIENMLKIINSGLPDNSFINLNENLSKFITNIIKEIKTG